MKSSIIERFWTRVDKNGPNGCWVWTGGKYSRGYGEFWDGTRQTYAHRIAFTLEVGEIPPGLEIDHKCHNRACVNPDHLRLASRLQNQWNIGKLRTNTSGFKGVTRRGNKWGAQIRKIGKHISLGTFPTPEAAYECYCAAAIELHGEFVNLGHTNPFLAGIPAVDHNIVTTSKVPTHFESEIIRAFEF